MLQGIPLAHDYVIISGSTKSTAHSRYLHTLTQRKTPNLIPTTATGALPNDIPDHQALYLTRLLSKVETPQTGKTYISSTALAAH